MKCALKALVPLVFYLLISPVEAVADPITLQANGTTFLWQVTLTNNTGMVVTGVHLNFTGTGGTIHDAMMVMNAPGAGPATITGMSNFVDITWGPPGLPPGGTVVFQFSTDFPVIMFNDGFWVKTPPQPIDPNRDNLKVEAIPEPATIILLSTGLAGVAINTRKRLNSPKRGKRANTG